MAEKKSKVPAEELEQSMQGEQPDDAKKSRSKPKAAPKKTQSGTRAKSSKKAAEDDGDVKEKTRFATQSSPSDEPVVSIAERRDAQTESDKAKNHLLDLMESYKAERVLTDFVQGVERINGSFAAVLYHGDFKVIIPATEAIIPPKDYRGKDPEVVHRYMLTKRLGTEFDYIVKGMDPETGIAVELVADETLTVKVHNDKITIEEPPKTGDESNMALWFGLLALSCFGMVGTVIYGRKRKREDAEV